MSTEVHTLCQKRRIGNPTVKAVLMYMSDRAADDGSGIWTSKANMAADLELSKRSVQNAIAELIERGLVSESGSRKCDRGFTVDYTINLARIEALESTRKDAKSTGESPAPVQHVHPKGCSTFTSTGESPAPNTSLEPSLNHPMREASLFGDIPKQIAPFGGQTIESMFDRFWKVYPKKVGKPAAAKNFAKAISGGADPERVIEGASRYAQWLTSGKRGEFRPHAKFPQGWLTEQRWEDPDLWQDDEIDPQRARLREITRQAQAAERRAN